MNEQNKEKNMKRHETLQQKEENGAEEERLIAAGG